MDFGLYKLAQLKKQFKGMGATILERKRGPMVKEFLAKFPVFAFLVLIATWSDRICGI